MTVDVNLRRAKQRVAEIKGFYVHFAIFVIVMCALLAIDAVTGPDWWVQWPFLGWGIGVLAHAFAVFGQTPSLLTNWEGRKVAVEKRRLDERSVKGPGE